MFPHTKTHCILVTQEVLLTSTHFIISLCGILNHPQWFRGTNLRRPSSWLEITQREYFFSSTPLWRGERKVLLLPFSPTQQVCLRTLTACSFACQHYSVVFCQLTDLVGVNTTTSLTSNTLYRLQTLKRNLKITKIFLCSYCCLWDF